MDVAPIHAAVRDQVHAVVDDEAVLRLAAQGAVERGPVRGDVGEGAGPSRAAAVRIHGRQPGHDDPAQAAIHAAELDFMAERHVPGQRMRDIVRRLAVHDVRTYPVLQARRDGERRQRAGAVVDDRRADAVRIRGPDARDKRCGVWHGDSEKVGNSILSSHYAT
ncbi:hypothetical protein ACCD08_23060 [Telluria sp. Tellsp104]